MTDLHSGVIPARCAECGAESDPRPLGITPYDWGRETEYGQGCYFCPECAPTHARMTLHLGVAVTSLPPDE